MANTVQLKKDGQIVYPVTDVSLIIGLQDAIKLPPIKTTTLPTASAETAGKMYYVGPDANDEYERYITSAVGGSYEWIDLGGTEIPLPSIADNLTTDDANTALSAKQGKVLNEEIEGLEAKVSKNPVQITESGKYIPTDAGVGNSIGSPTNSAVWSYIRIPVSPGDVLVINGVGGNAPRLWCFVDANAKILSVADAGTTGANLSVKAPSNSAEVIINVLIASAGITYYYPADSLLLKTDQLQEGLDALEESVEEAFSERVSPLEEKVDSLEGFTTIVVPENLFLLVDDYTSTTATSCEIQGDKITIVNNTGTNTNAVINIPAIIGHSYRFRFSPSVTPTGLNQTRLYISAGVFATLQQDETGYYFEFVAGLTSLELTISVAWNTSSYILDDVTLVDLADQSGECLLSSRLDKVPYSKKESEELFGDGIKMRGFPLYLVKDTMAFFLYADGILDHKCNDKEIYLSCNYHNLFSVADKNGKIKVDVTEPMPTPLDIPISASTRRASYNSTRMVYSCEKPSNPATDVNVLFMGDSYVSNKVLPDSFFGMLQDYGFSRVKSVGRQTTPSGTHFEANGGYAWQNYVDNPATLPSGFDHNYFWDSAINDISLAKYMETYCDDANLDYIVCNVLINNIVNPPMVILPSEIETKVRHFVGVVHTEFPGCKIIINGSMFGNPDILEPYKDRREKIDAIQSVYMDIANDYPFVYYLDVCSYFDGRSGMQTAERPINPWSNEMETYITDSVHPNESGYKMIANADVQCFLYVLKQAQS